MTLALQVAALAGTAGATWWVTSDHYQAVDIKKAGAYQQALSDANIRADGVAEKFERWKAARRPVVVTITERIERVLQAPENRPWADTPIPAGVRDAIAASEAELGAGQPVAAVPAVPASGVADQRGVGAGVPGRAGVGG